MKKINLAEKLTMFDSHWDPHVVAEYNGNEGMVVKFQGAFPYHSHADTDDFFLVLEGEVTMDYADHAPVTAQKGEIIVVPKGVVHRPRAETEARVLLIEPKGEPNSSDANRTPAPKPHI